VVNVVKVTVKQQQGRTMKMKKLIFVFLFLAMLCCAITPSGYCGEGFDDKEIRIGSWGPQTGPAAPWGSISRGAMFMAMYINEQGGIHGRKIKFILRDDKYNPAETKVIAKDLVERQDVMAVTAGLGSAPTLAVKDYLAENKVIAVGMCTGTKGLVYPVTNPYLFSSFCLFGDEMSVLTKYAVEKMKMEDFGFLYQNDPMGWDALNGARERLASYGMKFLVEIPVEPTEKDLSSQIMKLKSKGVKCVLMQVAPTPGIVAVKTAAQIGYKPQWISADTLGDHATMYKLTNGLWEGTVSGGKVLDPNGNDPIIVKYREAAKRLMPDQPFNAWFLSGIFFSEPLFEALKKAGPNLSKDVLLKSLNSITKFMSTGPSITWTPADHQGVYETRVIKCGPNGQVIVLEDFGTPFVHNTLRGWYKKSGI
jgi:branched-chain amino acid transport system substrate-binding protein